MRPINLYEFQSEDNPIQDLDLVKIELDVQLGLITIVRRIGENHENGVHTELTNAATYPFHDDPEGKQCVLCNRQGERWFEQTQVGLICTHAGECKRRRQENKKAKENRK